MNLTTGKIVGISGNMVTVEVDGSIMQNEVANIVHGEQRLKSEVVRITDHRAFMQVFESTKGLKVGDTAEFTGELLAVRLGPGLLGQIFDGLQNPLPQLAEAHGFFLPRGVAIDALDQERAWTFTPLVKAGDVVAAGMSLGHVPEGIFAHQIMVPFGFLGDLTVEEIADAGDYRITETIARLRDESGNVREVSMMFEWPVKIPVEAYREKILPVEPLMTKVRIIDTFFPVARGGTFCVPGPFGSGKTVLQQIISRHAEADVVIVAACGERAGEVVETLREFPVLTDPRTGRSLMERTIIICNTSSMPVAARESSVYTATTLGEYYRQMGLNVLLLADSTSRWCQAMRELSGRLEEIPGEEAFPAYLESRIAEFYERAGLVELHDGKTGSLTISGTVSPAGGTFEEPVTQSTLKVVGAFLGLSYNRAYARRYPAIDPLDSWSKYEPIISRELVDEARNILSKGNEVRQMMMVVGEEGTSLEDFEIYLKAEFLDSVYLQQNAFDEVDAACSLERQQHVFTKVHEVLMKEFTFADKDQARDVFYQLRQTFIDWNYIASDTDGFKEQEEKINSLIGEYSGSAPKAVDAFLGLSHEHAYAQHPAMSHLENWTRRAPSLSKKTVDEARDILSRGEEIRKMMAVVGEEETSLEDFETYLKAEFLDSVCLQQSASAEEDAASSPEAQLQVFTKIHEVLTKTFSFEDKDQARDFFYQLRQTFVDWNDVASDTDEFKEQEEKINSLIGEHSK